jgi:Organic solute transporter Ostalpha
VITSLGPYTEPENVSVGLNDLLICIEMPLFAIAHMYAFSHKDYIDQQHTFVARMPMYYAFRDAFGLLDVVEDSKATLRGEGMDYREFEPAEGLMHQGDGRVRRIRAGLRYSKGGQRKYWLPKTTEETHSPLLTQDADHVVHLAPDLRPDTEEPSVWADAEVDNGYELPFGDLDDGDEELYGHSQKYLFGDYNYPCVDVSSESARTFIWDEEERVLRDERGAWFSPIRGAKGQVAIQQRERPAWEGYGAVSRSQNQDGKGNMGVKPSEQFYDDEHTGDRVIDHGLDRTATVPAQPTDVMMKWTRTQKPHSHSQIPFSDEPSSTASGSGSSSPGNINSNRIRSSPIRSRHNSGTNDPPPTLPSDAVDLIVEDSHAAEEKQRKKGETASRPPVGSHLKKVYSRGTDAESVVEDHGESGLRRVDIGEETLLSDGMDGDDGPIIAIASTPPPHARVHSHDYDILDDDNPWA